MSKIFRELQGLVNNGKLKTPFGVSDVKDISSILDKSPSFISKHAMGNPQKYTEYFERHSRGKYSIINSSNYGRL